MDWFPLPIFPEGALSASVIVTVWVGITIVAITNLRLGWVLSGLVIPGYMVPILMVKPTVAVVVFAEGIVTYWLVWLYSEYMTRFTGLSSFFGRDRFFALVLASVAVRIVADGWLLPEIGDWMLQNHDVAFDYRSNLHSFGLIIVALIANNFWKTGLVRGALPMAVQVGLTWLIVRYGLMELTNFNMATLAFMYEDTASSFLASPKAYIVLLATAFIASRLNLFYGWDFSGILIPSLLALEWFEPHKILTTLIETAVILLLAELVLRLPVFRNVTMEGARKLLLFFNISFAYKFLLSWVLILFLPETKVTDWFGFGYLLATLLALKMHEKGIFARMTAATVQTSLAGVTVATLIGFALVVLPDPQWKDPAGSDTVALAPVRQDRGSIESVLHAGKTDFYSASVSGTVTSPLQRELDAFASGVRRLQEYRRTQDPLILESARRALLAANYEVDRVAGQYLLLRERSPARHWGSFALRLEGASPLLVAVPAPVDEPGAFEAGLALFSQSGASAFASAGSARRIQDDGSSDVLVWPQTMFQVFHRELAPREVLHVRTRPGPGSVLYLSGQIPESIDLKSLERASTALKVVFGASAERNLQRQTLRGNFSELWMSRADASRVQAIAVTDAPDAREVIQQTIAAMVRQTVIPQGFAAAGSNQYRGRRAEELLRIDRDVLSPLFELAAAQDAPRPDGKDLAPAFASAAASASSLGLELRWLADAQGDFFLLGDRAQAGGWIVIRLGPAQNFVVQVPRPLTESGILEISLSAFNDLRARMIVIAGAAPDANKDGSADVLARANARSLFTLAHQVALREMGDRPGIALQVRAFGLRADQPAPREDAVIAFDASVAEQAQLPELSGQLVKGLEQSGLSVRVGGGAADTAGYEASSGPQASYMIQTRNKRFAVLWVSPLVRRQTDTESVLLQQRQFTALGLAVRQGDAAAELTRRRIVANGLTPQLRADAERYRATGDVVQLSLMQRRYAELRFERLDDQAGRGAYLLIADRAGALYGVLALAAQARSAGGETTVAAGTLSPSDAERFVATRSRWMVAR